MLVPSMGDCSTPLTMVGSGSPAASRMVGATSMTWVNWERSPPCSLDAVRPVHDGAVAGAAPVRGDLLGPLERGVHRPRPADRVVVVGVRASRSSSILLSMNSGVSSAAMPLKLAISLKAPFIVPSAEAPLSPMM